MTHIPPKLLKEIKKNPFYRRCCLEGGDCSGRIEFHHNLIFKGKQVNEMFAILPLCQGHHEDANYSEIREQLDWIMLHRMSIDEIVMYSKAVNLFRRFEYLVGKYGLWHSELDTISSCK